MWEEIGISDRAYLIIIFALYFIVKSAIRNGINESVIGNMGEKDSIKHIENI